MHTTLRSLASAFCQALRTCVPRFGGVFFHFLPSFFLMAAHSMPRCCVGVAQHAAPSVTCLRCGYKLPFGLRVRLCELMLSSVFDSTAPAPSPMDTTRSVSSLGGEVFVDEKDELLESLQRLVWPVLGIRCDWMATPPKGCLAWVCIYVCMCT